MTKDMPVVAVGIPASRSTSDQSQNKVKQFVHNSFCKDLAVPCTDAKRYEVFIGNIQPKAGSTSPHQMTQQLNTLLKRADVEVPVHCIHLNRAGETQFAYVKLMNAEDEAKICGLDGLVVAGLTAPGYRLKVRKYTDNNTFSVHHFSSSGLFGSNNVIRRSNSEPILGGRRLMPGDGVNAMAPYSRELVYGQILPCEDRITEYKRGSGGYLRRTLLSHVRRYVCAFMNSEGGRLLIGVDDACMVHGIRCSRQQEDRARCQIDAILRAFQPSIFPDLYSVDFIPVRLAANQHLHQHHDPMLKVLEVTVILPQQQESLPKTLYQNDQGNVFVRRDGSVEGPLDTTRIIEWCRWVFTHNQNTTLTSLDQDSSAVTTATAAIVATEGIGGDSSIEVVQRHLMEACRACSKPACLLHQNQEHLQQPGAGICIGGQLVQQVVGAEDMHRMEQKIDAILQMIETNGSQVARLSDILNTHMANLVGISEQRSTRKVSIFRRDATRRESTRGGETPRRASTRRQSTKKPEMAKSTVCTIS